MSKISFFKFFTKTKFSVSDVNKYYVGVKPQPTLSCVGRIEKMLIKNSLCHPELAAPLVADEKEAYKGGCSQNISGSGHRQKCATICTVSGKEVLDKVGWAFSPTLKYCWGRNPNLQKAISSASRKATRHVRGDLVPAFTLAEVFLPYYHSPRKVAFTLAEVLITLGIIGVVAAMTIPTLLQNRVNTEVESKLKKVYSVMNQAILMSEQDNGPKEYWEFSCTQDENGNYEDDCSQIWEKYFLPYLKVLKYEKFTSSDMYNIAMYFNDGTILVGKLNDQSVDKNAAEFFFFPNGKNFDKETFGIFSDGEFNRPDQGITYFLFRFAPATGREGDRYHVNKGFEPYKYAIPAGNLTKEFLTSEGSGYTCNKNSNNKAYCTALIQLNGWKIPKDYPFKVR